MPRRESHFCPHNAAVETVLQLLSRAWDEVLMPLRPVTPEHWSWTLAEAVAATHKRRRRAKAAAKAAAQAAAEARQSGRIVFRAWL